MEEFKQGFIEEAFQLVEKLEEILLNLEENAVDDDTVQEIFRTMHTIKGSAAMFGFSNTEEITHILEDVYVLIRDKELELNSDILHLTITTSDILKVLLKNNDEIPPEYSEAYKNVEKEVSKYLQKQNQSDALASPEEISVLAADNDKPHKTKLFYIFFKPDSDILQRGIAPVSVFEELVEYGKITGFPFTENVPAPEDYDPANFFLAWDIFIKTDCPIDDIEDCFMFYLEHEFKIIEVQPDTIESNKEFLNTCINLNRGDLDIQGIKDRLNKILDLKEEEKPLEKEATPVPKKKETGRDSIESIKVDSKKLDELINLVSEFVTLNSRLEIQTKNNPDEVLQKTIKTLSKLSKRFRDNALELRLIPVKVLLLKLQRLVRDLSKSLDKEIEFITEGTQTELDKNIIARLESPLMHILRNSLDHGIESKEERLAAGKPAKGVIRFIAFYSGSNVFIQIQDDGKGIDSEKVKQKAIEKGIIDEKTELNKQDIFNLLFTPGFSTAGNVTNVSGRGVGLDVVKKEISGMRGEIDIESEKGLGTSFTLKLPLTLSIIDTLKVKVGTTTLLIPRDHILQTSIQYSGKNEDTVDKLEFEDQVIPVISLRSEFGTSSNSLKRQYNVIVKQDDKLYAIQVDQISGEHQAVVKPLGYLNNDHQFFSGASILGDGALAFILDVNKIISMKKNKSEVGNYNLK